MESITHIPSRQSMRHTMFKLAFSDLSKQYFEPRKARRKIARAISKQAFKVWRNGESPVNG